MVTWGQPSLDRSGNLRQVREIFSSGGAAIGGDTFAALREDGSVVTWGDPSDGGDSTAVRDQLMDVRTICMAVSACAAICGDGTVVTWGDANHGGDSDAVREQLTEVRQADGPQVGDLRLMIIKSKPTLRGLFLSRLTAGKSSATTAAATTKDKTTTDGPLHFCWFPVGEDPSNHPL